jgi:ATP-dependent Clp protease ATP-binding subunit ClpA
MFERFTQPAREVVVQAQFEARSMGHCPIGTQHVLLALIDQDGSVARALREQGVDEESVRDAIVGRLGGASPATDPLPDTDDEDAAALKAIGIDIDQVRRAIEANFGPGALRLPRKEDEPKRGFFGRNRTRHLGGHIPFSPRSKKVLELSLREALRLKHNFIAPEHIMLGLLREGEGMAALILAEAHVDQSRLRTDLTRALDEAA